MLAGLHDVAVIYGVTPDTISFGQKLISWSVSVVFVDESVSGENTRKIIADGGIVCTDAKALSASVKFLRQTGIQRGRRQVSLYAIHPAYSRSLEYAGLFIESLKDLNIRPECTRLTILGYEDILGEPFQAGDQKYGYGAVLDSLVMNGQFEGNHFQVSVFDPHYDEICGYLQHGQQEMLKQYDIQFYKADVRGNGFYEYLESHRDSLNYIAVSIFISVFDFKNITCSLTILQRWAITIQLNRRTFHFLSSFACIV